MPVPVPPIIDENLFYAARAQMAARDPGMGAAAVKTRTNLLTGHVVCGAATTAAWPPAPARAGCISTVCAIGGAANAWAVGSGWTSSVRS